LIEAWEGAQAETNPITKIFLDQGMFVWCAYYLSKSGAQQSSSFAGRADLRRRIDDLEKKSPEILALIAQQLAAGIPADVGAKVRSWLQSSRKRQRPSGKALFHRPANFS
jgi:hypothetical protein